MEIALKLKNMLSILKKTLPAVIFDCYSVFNRYLQGNSQCMALSGDIANCSNNMTKVVKIDDLAQSICNDFAANAYLPIEKFACNEDALGKNVCTNIEIMTENIENAAKSYQDDRNLVNFEHLSEIFQNECSKSTNQAEIPCTQAGKLAEKYKRTLADMALQPPMPEKKCCSCCCLK